MAPHCDRISPCNRPGQRLVRFHCKCILETGVHQRTQGATHIGAIDPRIFHQRRSSIDQPHRAVASQHRSCMVQGQAILGNLQGGASQGSGQALAPGQSVAIAANPHARTRQSVRTRSRRRKRLQRMEGGTRNSAIPQGLQASRPQGPAGLKRYPEIVSRQPFGDLRHCPIRHGNYHAITAARQRVKRCGPGLDTGQGGHRARVVAR